MTVILDPGNVPNYSYTDGASRQWKDTSGLWRTDAYDPNNTGMYAWSRANQLWRTSAQQWKGDYDTQTTNYNNMVADRNTWQGRANNAWGDSRVWSSGTSFEADRNYWRDTVAHGDANVWNTRYNAGYSAGDTAAQNAYRPPGIMVESGRFPHSNEGYPAGNLNPLPIVRESGGLVNPGYITYGGYQFTVQRAGHYAAYAHVDVHATWGGGVINIHLGGATYGRNFTGATDKTAGTGTPPVLLGAGSIIKFSGAVYAWNDPRNWGIFFVPEYSYPK